MGMVFVSPSVCEAKTLVFESMQVGHLPASLLQQIPCHGSAATFGVDGHGLGLPVFHHQKLGLYYPHGSRYLFPVEEMLHLFRGQMHEHTVVFLDGLNKD